jgi:hypothetical protein
LLGWNTAVLYLGVRFLFSILDLFKAIWPKRFKKMELLGLAKLLHVLKDGAGGNDVCVREH